MTGVAWGTVEGVRGPLLAKGRGDRRAVEHAFGAFEPLAAHEHEHFGGEEEDERASLGEEREAELDEEDRAGRVGEEAAEQHGDDEDLKL